MLKRKNKHVIQTSSFRPIKTSTKFIPIQISDKIQTQPKNHLSGGRRKIEEFKIINVITTN